MILACGTSWHAGLVGKFMIEKLARVPVEVDYGSEYRYRQPIADANTLAVVITQSGETADTLAALREAKQKRRTPASRSATSSAAWRRAKPTARSTRTPVRRSASPRPRRSRRSWPRSTCLALKLAQARGVHVRRRGVVPHVDSARCSCRSCSSRRCGWRRRWKTIAQAISCRRDALFLGRGINYPIALEGALKLKEISYIHAEGYPAGEMKHGPIALIDERMPVVVLAPHGRLFEKMIGNIQEVKARGGTIVALTTVATARGSSSRFSTLRATSLSRFPSAPELLMPILMPCRCSCWRITSRCAAAATSISREIWRRA